MTESQPVLKAGNRNSPLGILQAANALEKLKELFPLFTWEQINMSSPGDRDRKMDLRVSPGDFFSRDLDEAVIRGDLDCAIHSAKDLEYPLREELDWVWLPWKESREDAVVCRKGFQPEDLDKDCLIGVSSDRREAWCARRFPDVPRAPIRGNIEHRLAQLDDGSFDMVIIARAALDRLNLSDRITEIIPLEEMAPPEAQGILALTFRSGDTRFQLMRSLFVKAVRFVGSGPGSASLCTLKGIRALEECDVCLYDSLLDDELLTHVKGELVYTGKRSGQHSHSQEIITSLISDYARRGVRVVRLKGGDPGIFGRLAEETEELDGLGIPYEVIPGVSSLNAATTGTGMLLTRRGISRGYTAVSSRVKDGGIADTGIQARGALPIVFFMSLRAAESVIGSLLEEGRPLSEPGAVVYNAGSPEQAILQGTLETLPRLIAQRGYDDPGLLIIGEVTKYLTPPDKGALEGKRILLTCSDRLMDKAAQTVESLGGRPVRRSLIKLKRVLKEVDLSGFTWVVLTSPASIRFFMELLAEQKTDLRCLPKIMVCGRPSAEALEEYGLYPDLCPPASFGAEELIRAAGSVIGTDDRVLRLRSEAAGDKITRALTTCGAAVTDTILYTNELLPAGETCPGFDAVFFASSSGVNSFTDNWGTRPLQGKTVLAIGKPTAETLQEKGSFDLITGKEATIPAAIETLAETWILRRLKEML